MARPIRMDIAGGWYHLANRGAGRQRVFRNDEHRQTFLDLLSELVDDYGLEIHVYCLMTNRYDLVVHNHGGQLAAAMKHLNGVYTQRYNRMTGRDGPLFRGRYKSILFDGGPCLLAVSRHIQRRPLVTGTVSRLDRYRWSSYPSYVTRRKNPTWLSRYAIEEAMPGGSRAYRQYVEREGEPNQMVRDFYRSRRPGVILGGPEFRESLAEGLDGHPVRPAPVAPRTIIKAISRHYDVSPRSIFTATRGRLNEPRLAAVWLCRRRAEMSLAELADFFGMAGFGSASGVLHRIRNAMPVRFWNAVAEIERGLP
ncbi:MAG: transposase [Xanthomonadales bacterium]|nr:transposase [Xanthomonadales bacterium]